MFLHISLLRPKSVLKRIDRGYQALFCAFFEQRKMCTKQKCRDKVNVPVQQHTLKYTQYRNFFLPCKSHFAGKNNNFLDYE